MLAKWKKAYNSPGVLKGEWIAVAIVSLLVFFTINYSDLNSWTIWSTNLLDVISQGRPGDYYVYCIENIYGAQHSAMGAEFLVVVPLALWNIPIWILQKWFGLRIVDHFLMLCWSKLFFVVCLGVLAYLCYRIVVLLTGEKSQGIWAVFLTVSSLTVYNAVYYAGQTDIIWLAVGFGALYALLREKTKWFYILSAASIAMKPFFLLAYIALLCVVEKRLHALVGKVLVGTLPMLLLKLVCYAMPMYRESINGGPSAGIFGRILSIRLPSSYWGSSLLVVAFVLLCFFLYCKARPGGETWREICVYVFFAAQMLFLLSDNFEFYRMIIVSPAIYVLFMLKPERITIYLLLETVFFAAVMVPLMINFDTWSNITYTSTGILQMITGWVPEGFVGYPAAVEARLGMVDVFIPVFSALFATAGGLLLWLCYPATKLSLPQEAAGLHRWVLWLRLAVPFGLIAYSYLCYYIYVA